MGFIGHAIYPNVVTKLPTRVGAQKGKNQTFNAKVCGNGCAISLQFNCGKGALELVKSNTLHLRSTNAIHVDNASIERMMSNQKSLRQCYIATLRASVLELDYDLGETS